MSTSDMKKARVWAEEVGRIEGLMPGPRAAVEVIQSLPDTVVDGDKLREVINKVLANTIHGTVGHQVAEDYAALIGELIPAPPLPTLADMTPEEREACQWMQAQTWHEVGIILWVDEASEIAQLITRANGVLERKFKDVTPLPDLPKLEWPGSHADTITAESVEDVCNCRDCNSEESSLPRPEDVPAGEPWIVQHDGLEWVGVRANDFRIPWSITNMDGLDYRDVDDAEITLVSHLVPEAKP